MLFWAVDNYALQDNLRCPNSSRCQHLKINDTVGNGSNKKSQTFPHRTREREKERERWSGGGESGDKNVVKWIAHQSILLLSILLFVISFFAAPWHHVVPPRHCHGRQTVFVVCRPQQAEPSAADRVIVLVLGVLVVVLVLRLGAAGRGFVLVLGVLVVVLVQ